MKRQKLINKKGKKLYEGKCYFCEESNYHLLDVHRIHWGGEYSDFNTIVVCVKHHRLIHNKIIDIKRKYLRSDGKWVLHYFDENGNEHYD